MTNFKERLDSIQKRIEEAAKHSGRSLADISLIAICKQASVEQIREAYALGLRHFGESRLPSMLLKKESLPPDAIWHFVGTLQSNKAKKIASCANFLHSVSSYKTAKLLSVLAKEQGSTYRIFLEVNLSRELSKQGFSEAEILSMWAEIRELEGLTIQGLMVMGPQTQDKELVRSCFQRAAYLQKQLPRIAPFLSMGMSEDFSIAIEEGATHVRVGRELFSG